MLLLIDSVIKSLYKTGLYDTNVANTLEGQHYFLPNRSRQKQHFCMMFFEIGCTSLLKTGVIIA